jgi:hypothetical protein
MSNKREVREHRLNDSLHLCKGINEYLPLLSVRYERYGLNSTGEIVTNAFEQA